MSTQKLFQKKSTLTNTATLDNQLEGRGFAVQNKSNHEQTDLKTSLSQAEHYGYHLDRIQPASNSTGEPIQGFFKGLLRRKKTPKNLYRLDERNPTQIANSGFEPRNSQGNITLDEHVSGVLKNKDQNGGTASKMHSQYVSTGKKTMLQDEKILSMTPGKNLYKIDARGQNNYHSVKDHYQNIGKEQPYPKQKEWAHEGNIPPQTIKKYMTEQQLQSQLPLKRNPLMPWRKLSLKGWQDMQ